MGGLPCGPPKPFSKATCYHADIFIVLLKFLSRGRFCGRGTARSSLMFLKTMPILKLFGLIQWLGKYPQGGLFRSPVFFTVLKSHYQGLQFDDKTKGGITIMYL
jgi:hypothetical protein